MTEEVKKKVEAKAEAKGAEQFYNILILNGYFSYKCKSGNEYSGQGVNKKIEVKTKEDYQELSTSPLIGKLFLKCS